MTRRVVLFDIDNTLLYTGGAGSHAMALAFDRLYGVPDGFAGIEFSGRTDRFILQSGLVTHGVAGDVAEHLDRFTEAYYGLLPDSIEHREGHLMPGFPELLHTLRDAGAILGLATGNFSRAADIKLAAFGIADYFEGGGFGETSIERKDVVADAIREVANGTDPGNIVVIGDTPHDITSALDNGAVGIGVATGTYSTADLAASGANLVFEDFADYEAAAARLLGC